MLWDYGASQLAYFNGITVAFSNVKKWENLGTQINEESYLNKPDRSSSNLYAKSTERINTEEWSDSEINLANTAKYANYLTEYEKEVIKFMNLARLNGEKFLKNNFKDFVQINNSLYTPIDENNSYMI